MNWVLVTGAPKKLGAEICIALAHAGYDVAVHYRQSKEDAEKLAEKVRSTGKKSEIIKGDFASLASLQNFLKRYKESFSNTVGLINNVGNFLEAPLSKTSVQDLQDLFQTNLYTPFVLIQGLLDYLRESKGSVVNIGTAGLYTRQADLQASAYIMSKTSLLTLTKMFARELAKEKIRVNMVSPSYFEDSVVIPNDPISMGRAAKFGEVARMITFLLDPKNSYITGQNIEVAGGIRL